MFHNNIEKTLQKEICSANQTSLYICLMSLENWNLLHVELRCIAVPSVNRWFMTVVSTILSPRVSGVSVSSISLKNTSETNKRLEKSHSLDFKCESYRLKTYSFTAKYTSHRWCRASIGDRKPRWCGVGIRGGGGRVRSQHGRGVSGDRWCRSDTSLFKGIVVVWLQAAAGGTLAMWQKRR